MKNKKKKFYVIRNGPSPGIYTSVESYLEKSFGIKDIEAHGFFTQRGAERFMLTGAASKFYGVHIGREIGVVESAEEAQKLTRKVTNGCYKTFECREDAAYYAKTGEIQMDGHWVPQEEELRPEDEEPANSAHTKWRMPFQSIRSETIRIRNRLEDEIRHRVAIIRKWAEDARHAWWLIRKGHLYHLNGIALSDGAPLPCQIYTDGSSNRGWNAWSFVVYQGKKIIHAETGGGKNNIHKSVASDEAEMQAVMHAVKWLEKMQIKDAEIYYDNASLGKLVDGTAVPHTPLTKRYRNWMAGHLREMNIKMWKIKGHSGISGNTIADCMAKDALMRCHQDWTEDHVLI